MMKKRNQGNHAFTLIELSLAVMLIALVTAIGLPNFRDLFERSELQQVALDLTGIMRYAQERAIIERETTKVVIDLETNSFYFPVEVEKERRHYQTRSRKRSSRPKNLHTRTRRIRYEDKLRGTLPKEYLFEFVYKVAEDREFRRREAEFFFYPDGSVDAAYITILRLARYKEDERRMFIKTSSATGLIQMIEGRTERDGSAFYQGYFDDEYS
jgi:prepilin-type N-terminal cleavage/methylation domain-containing protein